MGRGKWSWHMMRPENACGSSTHPLPGWNRQAQALKVFSRSLVKSARASGCYTTLPTGGGWWVPGAVAFSCSHPKVSTHAQKYTLSCYTAKAHRCIWSRHFPCYFTEASKYVLPHTLSSCLQKPANTCNPHRNTPWSPGPMAKRAGIPASTGLHQSEREFLAGHHPRALNTQQTKYNPSLYVEKKPYLLSLDLYPER